MVAEIHQVPVLDVLLLLYEHNYFSVELLSYQNPGEWIFPSIAEVDKNHE